MANPGDPCPLTVSKHGLERAEGHSRVLRRDIVSRSPVWRQDAAQCQRSHEEGAVGIIADMAGYVRRNDRAKRVARRTLEQLGREIRLARLDVDLSQTFAAAAIGKSASSWSRLERGAAPALPLADLIRAAAVVGLDLHVRAYPTVSPLRDRAHLDLLERLRNRLPGEVCWATEVPLPNAGDKRAWDALLRVAAVRIGVEAETRVRDAQALQRRLTLKRRDGGVDHVILLLSDTRHNRDFVRSAGAGYLADFPVPGAIALQRLAAGEDPRGSSIILL